MVRWCDAVVPFRVPVVAGDVDGGDLVFGDLDLCGVDGRVQAGVDLQAGGGGGDQVEDHLVAAQRPAAPVDADEREQPVLDLVPLRRSRRKMAELEFQASVVREALQLDLPQMHARAVPAAAVGGDRQPRGVREARFAEVLPPRADARDRELRVSADCPTDTYPSLLAMS